MKFNAKTQQQRIAADQAIEDIERSNALNSSASLRAAFFHRQDAKALQNRVLDCTVNDMHQRQVAVEANLLDRRERLRIQLKKEESEIENDLSSRGLAVTKS
eukprot:m.87636 g.87636  ORF g.87636 m.87636 type:complete len:102 (-) comp16413_c0_seq1:209-514(-)